VEDKECMSAGYCFNGQRCKACPNGVLETVTDKVTILIDKGMHHEERVVIQEVMDEAPGDNVIPGNLEVLLRLVKHEYFEVRDIV
jgi:DnaJ-class molecular chaperone